MSDRGAHYNILLPAVTCQQDREAGQQSYEEGDAFALAQCLQLAGEFLREEKGFNGPGEGLNRWARAIGGQRELGQVGQLFFPVGELLLYVCPIQPLALPLREIRIDRKSVV